MSAALDVEAVPSHSAGLFGWFKAATISGRLSRLILFAIVCQICTVAYQLHEYRNGIWEQRRHELSNLSALALSIVKAEYATAESGKQTMEAAQAAAKLRLGALRYNKDDYFWVNDMTPRMVMHPMKPEMNGQDLSGYKDPFGKRIFVEFAETVRKSGNGFVGYSWPKPGADAPQPKLSNVVGFAPWQWVVGTGVYVDDLDTLFWSQLKTQGTLVLAMMIFCAIVSSAMGRRLARSVIDMSVTMEEIASGKLDVPIQAGADGQELGRMARALQIFQRYGKEKIALEQDAHSERERNEALRLQATEDAINAERQRVTTSFGTALARMAAKDLSYRLTEEVPEAYAQLQDDFNFALAEIEAALSSVRGGAEHIATGTHEMTLASEDLSRRTEQQAASLEETSAAMLELANAVNKTADASTKTKDVISLAKNEAVKSTEVVQQAIASIDGILQSSQQISQIITVIDEIAFQTNLLALNAGVEAARAGDSGRGFAVVASEVRALAQRSAEAAKEIKGLISRSSNEVTVGAERVHATGRAIDRIMTQISVIDGGIANIASQAIDQAITLKQVNTAIGENDQTTQKNAAMAEQATAACHLLAAESQSLAALVSEFKVVQAERGGRTNGYATHGHRMTNARSAA
ncbi:MAG: methyl-accepting chemotaxis sensory transducer with Cache sensor [Hyphomicrobiales bacterium]|nr:methyl-accepting chemotaxis sensory transducer with Cache sensor [Hyphomicrobiales bacterium]